MINLAYSLSSLIADNFALRYLKLLENKACSDQ